MFNLSIREAPSSRDRAGRGVITEPPAKSERTRPRQRQLNLQERVRWTQRLRVKQREIRRDGGFAGSTSIDQARRHLR